MIPRRLSIIAPATFYDMRTLVMSNVCLQTLRNNGLR